MIGMFGGLSLATRLLTIGGILLMLGGFYAVWRTKVYNKGYAAAIADIAAKDEKAIKRAVEAADAVDACYNSPGMRWDTISGKCVGG